MATISTFASFSTGLFTNLVVSGGSEDVTGTAITSGSTVDFGGFEQLSSGGAAEGTTLSGGVETVGVGGTASGTTISSGGNGSVLSGGIATGTTVYAGGMLTVLSSGTATGGTIDAGGKLAVIAGGTDSGTTISGGFELISSGGTATGAMVYAGGVLAISAEGTATDTAISASGFEYVSSGGADTDATVSVGGGLVISAGGTASGTLVSSGGQLVNSGGMDSGAVLSAEEDIYAGGISTSAVVNSSGIQYVESGATVDDATINSSGGQRIDFGGTASGTTVGSRGYQVISGVGATASGTIVNNSGFQFLYLGTVTDTTVNSGGHQDIEGNGIDGSAIASGTIVNSDGFQVLSFGAVASDAVLNDATQYVNSGGYSISGTVNSGAREYVSHHGTASAMTISSGGQQYVSFDGTASGTTVSGGFERVTSDGTASGTMISSGGFEYVSSGGTTDATTIGASGTLTLLDGSVVAGGIDFSGANAALVISGTTLPSTPISGLVLTDTITLADIPYDSAGSATLDPDTEILTVTEASSSYTLQLSGDLIFDTFDLSGTVGQGGYTTITVASAEPPPPTLITGNEIVDGEPTIAGTAAADSTVTLFSGATPIGSGTATGSGTFAITPMLALSMGENAITASLDVVINDVQEISYRSTPIDVFDLPAPVDEISTADVSSADLGATITNGATLAFVTGTEAIQLVDGTLSVGPDTNEAELQRLYVGLLGRHGDLGGLAYYDGEMNAGISTTKVANQILNSPEYISDQGTQTNAQLLNALYHDMLGRDPDPEGMASWTNALDTGSSAGEVAAAIAGSPESKAYLAASTAQVWVTSTSGAIVHDLFETGLGREVEPSGLAYYQTALQSLTVAQIAASIAASPEFMADHASQANSAYITSLYQDGLGRRPDQAGLTSWMSALSGGSLSRSQVLAAIATSPEAAARLTYNLGA